MAGNPWRVDNIQAFNYFCCPECVYRSKEELTFQAHALQNHPQSEILFCKIKPDLDDQVKEEVVKSEPEDNEDNDNILDDPDYEIMNSTPPSFDYQSGMKKRILNRALKPDDNEEGLSEASPGQSQGKFTLTKF